MPSLSLPTVAALTPPEVDVKITVDYIEEIDYDEPVDLVGLTAMTFHAPRAYQIADEFRRRGKKTILGGIHAAFCSDEALTHFDSVMIGEAEDLWEEVLRDARDGRLKKIYSSPRRPDLSRLVIPRFDLLDYSRYLIPPFARTPCLPLQTTRGCPNTCGFCSVHPFLGNEIRKKPVAHVVREIEALKPSLVFFTDDNICADESYARELFTALIPLRIRWACQMSTTVLRTPALIDLAARAGCHETFVGIESINKESLKSARKGFNKVETYKEVFRRMKEAGILGQASFIFGLDQDTPDTLKDTIGTILGWDIKFLYIFMLVPLPGTRIHEQFKNEGRIVAADWSLYDAEHPVIAFKNMSARELEDLVWTSYQRFYSIPHIGRMAWRFKKQYITGFPRTNFFEDVYFQFTSRRAVRRRMSPWTMGSTIPHEKES